ncbi:MAG: rhodanese-like domain-containing protein [Cocleimonas sp.]
MKLKHTIAATLITLSTLSSSTLLAEVVGITTGKQLQVEAEKRTKVINTADLKKALDEDLDMVLIDVRLPSEIKAMGGAIKASQNRNIPRGWLEYRITSVALSKDTPIVVYCGAGIRTPLAADTLQKMGYTNVKNYSAGFLGWRDAGLPVAQ